MQYFFAAYGSKKSVGVWNKYIFLIIMRQLTKWMVILTGSFL